MSNFFGSGSAEADAHAKVIDKGEHHAHWTHDLISGAAAFEAAKKYNEHVAANGKPNSHAVATELAAGFAGATIDHLFEQYGLNAIDKAKAKHDAKKKVEEVVTVEKVDETTVEVAQAQV